MASTRADEWRRLVRQWKKSGLSARRFAEQEGVAARTLAWWQWRFRSEHESAQRERERAKEAVRREALQPKAPVALVRVVAAAPSATSESPVELVFGDVLVRVRRGFHPETLGRVIDVLQGQEPRSC